MDTVLPFQASRFETTGINHGFFTRHGGVSIGLYKSLNIGMGAKDDAKDNIIQNRQRICTYMGVKLANLLTVYQVHGNYCVLVDELWADNKRPKADALVTDKPGIALGILTADCAPVLFHGEKEDGRLVIGAAHAGWRGAFGGILQETIKTMLECGAVSESIHAAVGPCIQRKSYEVSQEFYQTFITQDDDNDRFFMAGPREDHPHFDLPGYCVAVLNQTGIRSISVKEIDTYSNEEDFFSCRRATHREEPDYGRQISVIKIDDTP